MHPATTRTLPATRRDWIAAAVLAGIAFAVFYPAVSYGFITFDDPYYVKQNSNVLRGLKSDTIYWAFTTFDLSNWHPLTWLSLQLDATLWGTTPWGFHLTNVTLHAANAALLFLALRALTGAFWRSAAAALLFAVHPLRVESVAWVTERKDVLSAFFGLFALWAWAGYVAAPSVRRYLLVATGLALSLLAKPMMVTLPCLLLVLDWWPLRRAGNALEQAEDTSRGRKASRLTVSNARRGSPRGVTAGKSSSAGAAPPLSESAISLETTSEEARHDKTPARGLWANWKSLVVEKLPLGALIIASAVVTFLAQSNQGAVMSLDVFPVATRLENALVSYGIYLFKTFWPANLGVFYPYPDVHQLPGQAALAALVLVAITAAAIAYRRRMPYLLTGWLWYLGMLVPVIGLVQVGSQGLADRYTYFPQIGLLIALCWGVADVARQHGRASVALAAVSAVLLIVLTRQQLAIWGDSIDLWQHTLRAVGKSPTSLTSLGRALEDRGDFAAALKQYREAIAMNPDYALAQTCAGGLLSRMGKPDQAIPYLEAACRLTPNDATPYSYFGNVYVQKGMFDKAIEEEEKAIALNPRMSSAYCSMGQAEAARGNYQRAIECYNEALRLWPDFTLAHHALAIALLAQGDSDEAARHLIQALRLNPQYGEAHLVLGQILEAKQDYEHAGGHFEMAARYSPKSGTAWYRLGMSLARSGIVAEAERCLRQAVEWEPRSTQFQTDLARVLDARAADYAERGQRAEAVDADRQALDLATRAGNKELQSLITEQLHRLERGETGSAGGKKSP
jgi:protein O-mannosyl-transferase